MSTRKAGLLLLLASVCPGRLAESAGLAGLLVLVGGGVAGIVGGRLPVGPLSTRRRRSLLMEPTDGGDENGEEGDSGGVVALGRFKMDRKRLSSRSPG